MKMAIAFENIPEEFVSKTAFYDYKVPITEILGKLKSNGAVVLTKNGEFYGIIDDRTVAAAGGVSVEKKAASAKYAVKTPILDRESSIGKAIHYFYGTGTKALPYSDSGKIRGIVKRDTVLKAILSMHMLSGSKVGELMSAPLISIDSAKTVAEASSNMRQKGINRLVVTSAGKLSGILSYGDILRYSSKLQQRGSSKMARGQTAMQGMVSEIMETDLHSIRHNESIDAAIRGMVENGISSLLVTRSGEPAGIITVKDIFAAAARSGLKTTDGIFISGIDQSTEQYEEDIRAEAEKAVEKINKFAGFKVDSISVHVRKHKVRNYEIQARVWLARSGALSVSSQGYSIEFTVKDALGRLYNAIKSRKEMAYMGKKGADSQYALDEK